MIRVSPKQRIAETIVEHPAEIVRERVALCVCSNGRGSIAACLHSLLAQSISESSVSLSVILVDNTANGELGAMIPLSEPPSRLLYTHEPRPGIPFARNAAVRTALQGGADYIAFIDDDEVAPQAWIQLLYSQLKESGADVVQGGLERVATLDEAIDHAQAYTPGTAKVRNRNTAATNNVLFKTWLVTGPNKLQFDEALAMVGGSDTEFFMRANDAGAKIVRASHPPVFEIWNGARETRNYAWKRAWRCGASTNYRYRKNRHAVVAASVLLARACERTIGGVVNCIRGVALYAFSRSKGESAIHKGISGLGFAAGCLTPYASVRPTTYY